MKKQLINKLKKALIGSFFAIISILSFASIPVINSDTVFAVPGETTTNVDSNTEISETENVVTTEAETETVSSRSDGCRISLGPIAWLGCSISKVMSDAVDTLYGIIEDFLVINPIPAENGSPIYEVWKYLKGITNIVFILFLLVVIYSQITGFGINNYGIKKALPKLIVAAVLVNLSFLICQIGVDLSNTVGNGLRGVFTSIEESTGLTAGSVGTQASFSWLFSAISGATIAGAAMAFHPGMIFMLIPTVLGALVSVATGLITIGLRQAVVALLVMISPLAMVAYVLPNTEKWFAKWKDLLFKMLVFYPMFSLLFGASHFAGLAMMVSAKNGFGIILGMAIQVFPLFFSWKMMSMSGTFLNGINAKLNALAAKPLAANRAWAESKNALSRARYLEKNRMPSAKLMNFLAYRKYNREAETEAVNTNKKLEYQARRNASSYDKRGNLSKQGLREYDRQALATRYAQFAQMHKDNLNEGFSKHDDAYKKTIAGMRRDLLKQQGVFATSIEGRETLAERVKRLDNANMNASDDLKFEIARGAKIDYKNSKDFLDRVQNAIDANIDKDNAGEIKHRQHGVRLDENNVARYDRMKAIMGGKDIDVQFAASDAASAFNAQAQIVKNKFQSYLDLTPATQDVVNRLKIMTQDKNSSEYIDSIIAGLRTLNMRGDTDLVREQVEYLLGDYETGGKIQLGTYASQSLANFLMFDVKGNDMALRRLGKYINLETARMYNEMDPEKRRTRKDVSLYEYINGEFVDRDENGQIKYNLDGTVKYDHPKRSAEILLEGTSIKDMERTAISNMTDMIRRNSYVIDENGNKKFDLVKFMKNEDKLWNALMPNIITDHFSLISDSEQIIALGKGITGGIDVRKHKYAWKDVFGDEAKNLTLEDKKKYIDHVTDARIKPFLGGQVPMHIVKTKSNMLEAIRTSFALKDAIEKEGDSFLKKIDEDDYAMSREEFDKTFEPEHLESIRARLLKYYKPNALEGFAKMVNKGYSGDAKDKLIELLQPDELYEKMVVGKKRQRKQRSEEHDDGMPAIEGDNDVTGTAEVYNNARIAIESIFEEYRGGGQQDVQKCWDKIKSVLVSSPEMGDLTVTLNDFEGGLPQFTSVGYLREQIMRTFFGSD